MPATASDVGTGSAPGPLDGRREERPSPMSLSGFLVMLVAMVVEAVVLVILLKPSPLALATQVKPGEGAPRLTIAELLAPTIVMPEVVVSVPVKQEGTDLMTAVVSVAIELGRTVDRSDEELDLGYLRKAYVPKVEARMHEFRHELFVALNTRTYAELRSPDTQNKILENLRKKMNDILREYGVEPRIRKLYWNSFHFD